jgi:hypothetical protein
MFDSPRKHTCTYNLNIHIIQFICKGNSLEIFRSLLFVVRGYTMAGTDCKFHHRGFSFYRQYHQVHFIHGRGLSVALSAPRRDSMEPHILHSVAVDRWATLWANPVTSRHQVFRSFYSPCYFGRLSTSLTTTTAAGCRERAYVRRPNRKLP